MVIKIRPSDGSVGKVFGPKIENVEIEDGNVTIFFYNNDPEVTFLSHEIESIDIYP